MPDVFIIAPLETPVTSLITKAMSQAILAASASSGVANRIQILGEAELDPKIKPGLTEGLICPLTLNVPDWLPLANRDMYAACADVERLRRVSDGWQDDARPGAYWLPIVLTAKGPLYAEAIAQVNPSEPSTYRQPFHLTDSQRQPLYSLGFRLLQALNAPPAVYMMQFGCEADRVWFDRLLPFPTAAAIASLEVQTPDLFTCHWACLTEQPIRELSITA